MKDSTYKIVFIPIFFYGLLNILDFFFKDYNDRNNYGLPLSTYVIIFSITLVIILAYVYRHSQEKDRFIKFVKGFAYGVFFGFITVFYIGMVKDQTAFYLNKLFSQKLVKEDFKVKKKDGSSKTYRKGIYRENKKVGSNKTFLRPLFLYGAIPSQKKGGKKGNKVFPEIVKDFADAQLIKIWLREIKQLAR